ncbi:hypothetical protein [Leptospira jelokensis]|uniref:DUF2029 domain-containing protein n=1 Tax=Leptospira jelokensis TaxID=2484931 RepID=A0A4Z1A0G1_9LEPT|nr:hypothetical protein [Leptospira jelokensis]TGL67455.1 hypothetical protein EHQ62_08610 [Leptospira jelokensis]
MFLLVLYPFLLFFVVHGMDRNDLPSIIVSTFSLSSYFFFLHKKVSIFQNNFPFFFMYGVALRCVVLGVTPHLSDDIYRYLFDAKLLVSGFDPYEFTPSDWIKQNPTLLGRFEFFLSRMNSPDYVSVYPLLLLFFYICGSFINEFISVTFLANQILFLFIDVLNLLLIRRFYPKEPLTFYWIYFANPLVIIEGISQMHPEILFIPWLLLLIRLKENRMIGMVFLILTQLKLNTILFLFSFFRKSKQILVLTGFVFLSLFLWKATVFGNWLAQGNRGIGLFLHSFRFAGILEPFFYFTLRGFGLAYLSGIFSLISFLLLALVFSFHSKFQNQTKEIRLFLIYTMFLLFSPVVHPWYWIPFVFLGMICRIPILWQSFVCSLGFFSYAIYVSESYFYLYWMYSLLGLFFYAKKDTYHLRKAT